MNNAVVRSLARNISPISVIILTFLILSIFYRPILFHPQDYVFSDKGDGIKNYYCFEWHVHNDSSFVNYTGSNYPFGENHGFTDGFPLLSNALRLVPFLKPYSIGIFNFTLLFSFVLCALLVYKILKELKVMDLFAVIASIGITLLCPQVFRLTGHLALAYNFCVPLIFYLLIKQEQNPFRKKYLYLIAIACLCFLFTHPYLGMIVISFLFFYWLIKLLFIRTSINYSLWSFFIQVIIPLSVYFAYTRITDTHTDRGIKPYGFFYFTSSIETVFISTHKPFRHLLSLLYPIREQNYEGLAYIGITSLISVFGFLFFVIRRRKTIKASFQKNHQAKVYLIMTCSAVILLLFSMGYPFRLNLQWLADLFPAIEQFRVVGRFAWVFYFIATIGSTVLICNYFAPKMKKSIRVVICCLLLALFFIEAIPFHKDVAGRVIAKNCFDYNHLEDELKSIVSIIKAKNPKAVIPLPFYHFGTDYYTVPATEKIYTASNKICYHAKVPLMANHTARNSLTEAEKLIQVIGSDLIVKTISPDIPPGATFIILYSKEILTDEETALLKKGNTILETSEFIVKEISSEKLLANSISTKTAEFLSQRPRLLKKNGWLVKDSSFVYFDDFSLFSTGQFEGNARAYNLVKEFAPNTFLKDTLYEVSFWYKTKDRFDLDNLLTVSEISANNDTTVLAEKNIKTMLNLRDQKTFATLSFETANTGNKMIISLKGISDREKVFYIDDLLVKEKANMIYKMDYSPVLKDSVLKINTIDVRELR